MFKKIQSVIRTIPRGKVSSYGAVAKAAGFPGAARQVVWALRNAQGLPWHRVVAAGGRIALPGEAGFDQRMRLESEGVPFSGSRVRMDECEFVFPRAKKTMTTKPKKAHKSKSGKPVPQRSRRTQRKKRT
jgi:alkylated DNA nucleotide flippase Atl1